MGNENINWEKFNNQVKNEGALYKRLKQRENEIIPSASLEIKLLPFAEYRKIIDYLNQELIEFSDIKVDMKATEKLDLLDLKFNDISSFDFLKVIGFLKENNIKFNIKNK